MTAIVDEPTVERMLPLYEAKMIHHYDHRWATYDGDEIRDVTLAEKRDPNFEALPRYWVRESVVLDRVRKLCALEDFMGYRRITNSTNERTMVCTLVPRAGFGDSVFLMTTSAESAAPLQAIFASFAFDYVMRQKLGGTNANFFIVMQLPAPTPETFSQPPTWNSRTDLLPWMSLRVTKLLTKWNIDRDVMKAELDAAAFHIFGIAREDVDYIMETFPIVKRRDEAEFGEYRTKRLILEIYDQMSEAIASGLPYQSPFDEETR